VGRIPDSTVSRTWHSIKNDLRHADELAQSENGQYTTSAAAHLKLLKGERHVALMFTPSSISKCRSSPRARRSRVSVPALARLRTASTSPMICSFVDSTASLWDIDPKDHPRTNLGAFDEKTTHHTTVVRNRYRLGVGKRAQRLLGAARTVAKQMYPYISKGAKSSRSALDLKLQK
jgi:hypothetical protein